MRDFLSSVIGKGARAVARLRGGGGGGSALPGLIVERLDPGFMTRVLQRLPLGVVAVSGTNGKTTTTKMIVEMLESQGLTVFTNRTGSNFSRGVVAAAVQECSIGGRLDADIAVLELDEAHAMHFIDRVKPRTTLLLNVLRDQLDRFGEIDTTARYLQRLADATTSGLVANREDRLIATIGAKTRERGDVTVRTFGLSDELLGLFPSDDDFHTAAEPGKATRAVEAEQADVMLVEIGDHEAVFEMDGERYRTPLQLEGLYNMFNAAAALSTVRMVQGADSDHELSNEALVRALSTVRPAFGRGERLELDGQPLDLVLVKNPAGFRLALASFEANGVSSMIAINDDVAGTRAWDMALRLQHDDVPVGEVQEDLRAALHGFRERTMPSGDGPRPRRIYCTYTAMLALRRMLGELTDVEEI
jgi:UDP-N-acetylmuramyl tripeptide synthase